MNWTKKSNRRIRKWKENVGEKKNRERKRRRSGNNSNSRKEIKQYSFIQQYEHTRQYEYVWSEPLSCYSICVCVSKFIHKRAQPSLLRLWIYVHLYVYISHFSLSIDVGISTERSLYTTHFACYLLSSRCLASFLTVAFHVYCAVFIRVLSANLRASYYVFIYPLFRFFFFSLKLENSV